MRIAIIGSGVSGLVSAHLLRGRDDVVLYESDGRPGGHSHTHRLELPELTADVDTGFLVDNERTYPLFSRLLDQLGRRHPAERHELQRHRPGPASSGAALPCPPSSPSDATWPARPSGAC